jgi:chromosome segregation ATPase
MALAGKKAPRHGWRHQAERLALNHTGVATAAWAATERRPLMEPVSCHYSVAGAKSERDQDTSANKTSNDAERAEQQMAREAAAAWILNARRETLAARAAKAKAAEERIAELEAKLDTALERIAFQANENQSLQTSLDLTLSENLRLSNHVSESDAKLKEISSELEQLKTSEAERNKLSSVVDKKIELLQNLLQVKERRVQKLEQARLKLTDDTKTLLRTCAKRDQALARAEERISSLTELFAQLETKVDLATNKGRLVERHSRLQREQRESPTAEGSGKMTRSNVNLWKRELDCDEWLLGRGRG